MANVVFDEILGKVRAGDISGGTSGGNYIGGFGISIEGQTVNKARYMPVETVSGPSVTLMAGHAYKVYATSAAITLNTETIPANQFGLEGHIEIFVSGTGYVVTGTNVVLANALEPDAVNNCTVRFHDGYAIISVEDHIAGYVVTVGTGSTSGTLPYALSSASQEYVAFDASLNGQTIDMGGAVTNVEKHVVGNGYAETILTGGIICTSKTTFANLAMSNVAVSSGTLTLGDVYIPNGATVAVSGGGLAIEKVTGDGGVIDLGGTFVNVPAGNTANANGCHFYADASSFKLGGSATLNLTNCRVSATQLASAGVVEFPYGSATVNLSSCTISDIPSTYGALCPGGNGGKIIRMKDCIMSGNGQDVHFVGPGNFLELSGSNYFDGQTIGIGTTVSGTIHISSGAVVDLTGNTYATPIAPGGGIIVADGDTTASCTIINSAGSSVPLQGGTYSEIFNTGGAD